MADDFNELPPGKLVKAKVLSIVEYGVFVQVREGVEGLIPQNELVLQKDETGEEQLPKIGEEVEAEIANIDSQERRLTLSMRRGEVPASPGGAGAEAKPAGARPSKAPKKGSAAEAAAGGTIGELIKQKLGAKLAQISSEKKDDEGDDD